MNATKLLPLPLLCAAILLAGCNRQPTPPKDAPNVLLISLCSVRADHMSCYGYERVTTPNLDYFASQATVFDAAFTQWPKTTPGFAAIMTAKYGHANGILRTTPGQVLDDSHTTLAEVLKRTGYDTAAFLSTAALNKHTNIRQGFDHVEDFTRQERWTILPTERSLAWLKQREGKRPFFAWVHYNNAHYKYFGGGAPDAGMFVDDQHYDASRTVRVFDDPTYLLDIDVPRDHPCYEQIRFPDVGGVPQIAALKPRSTELDFYLARYDAGIYGGDDAIGKLLLGLKTTGLLENTIVAIVGDHGESLGEHDYYFQHGRFAYNVTAHVPLMIRGARQQTGRRIDTPVAAFDLAPTLLEMIGLESPADWQARSLLPLIEGRESGHLVFMEAGYQLDYMLAVWDGPWKLIHIPNPIDRKLMTGVEYELYNWREDPGETNNLIETHPEQARRLRETLKSWSAPWVEQAYQAAPHRNVDLDPQTQADLEAMGYKLKPDGGD